MNGVRNFSAHHSRLWNRTLIAQASRPAAGTIADLDHLQSLDAAQRTKIYPTLAILSWILKTVPAGDWNERLVDLLKTFPTNNIITLGSAGFPGRWEALDLWQR
jgi:abortive infection bacteriophage resistance protein